MAHGCRRLADHVGRVDDLVVCEYRHRFDASGKCDRVVRAGSVFHPQVQGVGSAMSNKYS